MNEHKGLGRIHKADERDNIYLLQTRQPITVVARRTKRWPLFHRALDQGATGTCVGHAWKHWMLIAPTIQTTPQKPPTAIDIYRKATEIDEWQGNEGDLQFGTSIRAGAQAMRSFGLITEFNWAFTAAAMADWLAGVDVDGKFIGGPMVIGVNWYNSMFDTDAEGFLRIPPTARVVGGHAIAVDLYNETEGSYGGPNSWGDGFGPFIRGKQRRSGRWKMAGEVMERLIEREDGEAATAREIRR